MLFCCGCCALTSVLAGFILLIVGHLISIDYKFVGEWNVTGIELPYSTFDEEHEDAVCYQLTPDECSQLYAEQRDTSSKNFFIGGAIYMAFLVLSTALTIFYATRKKR